MNTPHGKWCLTFYWKISFATASILNTDVILSRIIYSDIY